MINVEEHIYHDDPKVGHPDVRTFLKDANYFFLGNGLIQAAIQFAPDSEGSPYGFIIMNPEKLKQKRQSLTFDPDTGFANTMIHLKRTSNDIVLPHQSINAEWKKDSEIPTVQVQWSSNSIQVKEFFYCPNQSTAQLIREIHLRNLSNESAQLMATTGVPRKIVNKSLSLSSSEEQIIFLKYSLANDFVDIELLPNAPSIEESRQYWEKTAALSFHHPLLDHFFTSSNFQLASAISRKGKIDASIWQYCREWVRDHSFMAMGLILSGHHDKARVILQRLLDEFVSDEGDCIDSSEKRNPDEVELDQNGTLLWVLKNYVLWTGDYDIISKNWDKIVATAEFPLKEVFRHQPSGMFFNCREYWERHAAHGIKPGIELMYQVFPSIGLISAAMLARMISKEREALRWDSEAKRLKEVILNHPTFASVDNHGFIKRRNIEGTVQETVIPRQDSGLPAGVPLAADIDHFLNPDASSALPIALGFVSSDSPVVKSTLQHLELLWNQRWDGGGYGRYHMTSEPDSAGPWPTASLIIARAYMETGDYDKVWRILNWLNTIPGSLSGAWFEMYGPRIAPPYAQIGILPWTCGEMIMLFVHHIVGIRLEENYIRVRPRLLPGLEKITGSLPLRNHRLYLDLTVNPSISSPSFKSNVKILKSNTTEILLPFTNGDIHIEASLPHRKSSP